MPCHMCALLFLFHVMPCHTVCLPLCVMLCRVFAFADLCRAIPCPPGADLAHAWKACLGAACHPVSCEFSCRSVPGHSLVRGGPCYAVTQWRLQVRAVPCHVISLVCSAVAVPCLDLMQVPWSVLCRLIFTPCSLPS